MNHEWQIGDLIQNRWEILSIRRGGLGIVYIVNDFELDEVLAFKTFRHEVFTLRPETAERFTLEALVWINLDSHPNVTQARFVDNIGGQPYLFLEYVDGGDLNDWIGTPRLTRDLPQVLRFALQFCDGMTHALSKGITAHRDIKPQNCLITSGRTLKVTDFGLAKVFDDALIGKQANRARHVVGRELTRSMALPFGWAWEGRTTSNAIPRADGLSVGLTRTGLAAGTLTHMAPEQFDDAKHVDVRADIYSFGVMLFQMVEGKLPFGGRTRQELEQQHKIQPPPVLTIQDGKLREVLEQCLAKDVGQRFSDFESVRVRLAEVYERLTGVPAPPPTIGRALTIVELINKGITMETLGRMEAAVVCYDRALELNPRREQMDHICFNKGRALRGLGRIEEALVCYDCALEANPRNDRAWNNKGNALRELGWTNESLVCYDRALEINPNHELAWNNKGTALMAVDRTREALACYEQALILNPRHELAWTNKGRALALLGQLEEGIKCFDQALEVNPRDDIAWSQKAVVLGWLERREESIICYERALQLKPHDMQTWLDHAWASEQLGRMEEAIASYDRVLKMNPQHHNVWLKRGVALDKLGRTREAIDSYDHVLEINQREQEAWNNKGIALLTLGRAEEAIDCHNQVLAINPRNDKAWSNKGYSLLELGQMNEALACFDRALEINPKDGQVWSFKGGVLGGVFSRMEEALTCFDRALEINARDYQAWYNKGVALYALNRAQESMKCFELALEINPRDEKSWLKKGTVLFRKLRRSHEALACFEEAKRLGHPQAEQEISRCRLSLNQLDNHN